jgi:nitrile hydratase alpha subunit
MTDKGRKIWNEIVTKAWADLGFRGRLIENPAAVLKEHGLQVPGGANLRIVENTDQVHYMVLPSQPSDVLSDAELEQVGAGAIGVSIICRTQQT